MNLRLLLGGLKSYLPARMSAYTGTGGTTTGAYCYSVWMRHLSIITRHVPGFRPHVVVEPGPGDSIGLGLAALLSGARTYHGLDVLEHASLDTNNRVLEELLQLFRARAALPDERAFPKLLPRLASYAYPAHLLDERVLEERLAEPFVSRLRAAIGGADPTLIHYACPWSPQSVAQDSANLVISQVALQDMDHVPERDDLHENLRVMASWLKPGGVMSHQIDFSCPGGDVWNHHWAYSSLSWKIIRGQRPYYVNRAPLSEYVRLFAAVGCEVVGVEPSAATGMPRDKLAAPFRQLPEADLHAKAALVVAVKRARL